MGNLRHGRWLRLIFTALFSGLLHGFACAKGPVCLDKSERKGGPVFALFSPDGKWLAAMAETEIVLWDFATRGKVITKPYDFSKVNEFNGPPGPGFTAIAFTPDSQRIVYAGDAGRVCVWDGSAGWADAPEREILQRRLEPDGRPKTSAVHASDIAISPDGKLLAVPREMEMPRGMGTIKILELDTGKEVGELARRMIGSPKFADHGKRLLLHTLPSAPEGWYVEFCDMETLKPQEHVRVIPPRGLRNGGYALQTVLSPAEDMLAAITGNMNHTFDVRLYEFSSRRWTTLANSSRFMQLPSFSPDGGLLAVSTMQGPGDPAAVFVWDLTAKVWRRFDCPPEIAQENDGILNVTFSPNGRYLAGGLTHPQVAVCIWDLQEDAKKTERDQTVTPAL